MFYKKQKPYDCWSTLIKYTELVVGMYTHLETMKKEPTGPALPIKTALFTIKARCILFSTVNFLKAT